MWLQYNYTLNPIGIFNAIKYMYTYYPDPNNRSHIREEFVNFWSDYFFVAPQVSIQGLTQPLSHQGGLCQLLVRLLLLGTSGQYIGTHLTQPLNLPISLSVSLPTFHSRNLYSLHYSSLTLPAYHPPSPPTS